MIVRLWRGITRLEDADAYEKYLMDTGYVGYTTTAGNLGVCFARHDAGDLTEFMLTSHWDSWEAIRAFAGDDPERAIFYPDDDRYLVEREPVARHYEVFGAAGPPVPATRSLAEEPTGARL
jgi:hypothetical protein